MSIFIGYNALQDFHFMIDNMKGNAWYENSNRPSKLD